MTAAELLTALGARDVRDDGAGITRAYFHGRTPDGRDAHVALTDDDVARLDIVDLRGAPAVRFPRRGTYTGTVTVPLPAELLEVAAR